VELLKTKESPATPTADKVGLKDTATEVLPSKAFTVPLAARVGVSTAGLMVPATVALVAPKV
jgi:hypothetical protein